MQYRITLFRILRQTGALISGVSVAVLLLFGSSVPPSNAAITGCCINPSISCTDNVEASACSSPKMFFPNVANCRNDAQTKTACDKVQVTSPRTANPAARDSATTTTTTTSTKSNPLTFVPNVPIPNLFGTTTVDETLFGKYVNAFYVYFAGVAGILAVVMFMWGGYHYVTSFGSPQRMSQGKEIISSALIGLILVLTSYLLLNIINPRLTKLILPSVGYYSNYLLTGDQYCEGQDLAFGNTLATDAARAQGKVCGPDNTVKYKDAEGNDRTCFSLALPPDYTAEPTKDWDKQYACFFKKGPKVVDGSTQMVSEFRMYPASGADGVCENDEFTRDDQCSATQTVLSLQPHLKGACKRADIGAGSDRCKYFARLSCPNTQVKQVSCSAGGQSNNTACWKDGKPNVVNTPAQYSGGTRAHCAEPGTTAIEYVDGACCMDNVKERIICSVTGPLEGEIEVDCDSYNPLPGNFIEGCKDRGKGKVEGCYNFVGTCGADMADHTTRRCFAGLYMFYQNNAKLP